MTPGQCRAARSWLGWSTRETAERAGVARATLVRFEGGFDVRYSSMDKIRKTFESAGIEFQGRTHVVRRGEEGSSRKRKQ